MMKLLSIEFKKVLSYSAFWVFISLYAALLLLVFLAFATFKMPGMPSNMPTSNPLFIFPALWHTLTYVAGWFNLLFGVLIVILITNEFTFRTVRQNIIDGWSVNQFVSAKVLLLVFLALAATIYVFLIGIVYGLIASPSKTGADIFGQMDFVLAYFVQALGYFSFALFMGTLFKKAGMGIIFFLLYTKIIEFLIGLPLPDKIENCLPFHSMSKLISFPIEIPGMSVDTSPLGIQFGFALFYSCLFILGTWLLLKKRDI